MKTIVGKSDAFVEAVVFISEIQRRIKVSV